MQVLAYKQTLRHEPRKLGEVHKVKDYRQITIYKLLFTNYNNYCEAKYLYFPTAVSKKSNHTARKLFLRELTKRKHLEQTQPPHPPKKKNTHLLTSQSSPSSIATQPIQDPK